MATDGLVERSIRNRAYLARVEADPLSFWRHSSPQSERATLLLNDCDEVYARAGSKGGKTEWACAVVTRILQKQQKLDGIKLPYWRGPVTGIVLCLDYTQQKHSVQQTLLRLLGKWPYRAHWKGDGILGSIKIKPVNGTDDESTWSTLTLISQENRQSGLGARADIVWADEPPIESIWRELRKAAHAGRRMVRIISATPTIRRQWAWLKDDYGDPPRGSVTRNGKRAEVRWAVHDNNALSKAEIADLLAEYRNDPFFGKDGGPSGRVYGDYMTTEGGSPWGQDGTIALLKMRDECVDPKILRWKIGHEGDDGAPALMRTVDVEVFENAKPNSRYWMTIDASSGVDDAKHDPYEIEIGEIGSGALVARVGGRMPGKLVGILGAGLCRQYNNTTADPEINDRWGVNVLDGFSAARYSNFARERRQLRPGEWVNEIGFHNNAQSRPEIIGSVQAWIEAWRAGHKYAKCPSRFIIDTLLDCILDEDGKIVAAPGLHDEALICWGQMLRRAVRLSNRIIPQLEPKPDTADSAMIRRMRGLAYAENGSCEPVLRGRERP
jgi:hypothetical protein